MNDTVWWLSARWDGNELQLVMVAKVKIEKWYPILSHFFWIQWQSLDGDDAFFTV